MLREILVRRDARDDIELIDLERLHFGTWHGQQQKMSGSEDGLRTGRNVGTHCDRVRERTGN
jgi:hypothetical protein